MSWFRKAEQKHLIPRQLIPVSLWSEWSLLEGTKFISTGIGIVDTQECNSTKLRGNCNSLCGFLAIKLSTYH